MDRRDKAATLALAGALLILAAGVLAGDVSWRLVIGMVIIEASIVMAVYYILDREAEDRHYGTSVFILAALAGAFITGAEPRLVAAVALVVVAVVLFLVVLQGGSRREKEG